LNFQTNSRKDKHYTTVLGAKKIDQNRSAAKLSGSGRPRTISQDLIDSAINQWSKRLMMVIQAQGGHMENRLK